MLARLAPLVALLVGFLAVLPGCTATGSTAEVAPEGDVVIDGVSVLGAWEAVGAPDQAGVDADLRNGALTRRLVFNPYGRVTLSGEDRRAGTGLTAFRGRVSGRTVTFEGLDGTARVATRTDGTLVLTDPGGNRTVYRRQG